MDYVDMRNKRARKTPTERREDADKNRPRVYATADYESPRRTVIRIVDDNGNETVEDTFAVPIETMRM